MSAAGTMNALFASHGAAIHTAFPAKVLSCNGTTAKIQPLFNFNGAPSTPLEGIPVPQSVRKAEVITETVEGVPTHWTKLSPPSVGDIVYCVVAEQTLGSAWKGKSADRVGNLHHQLGDAVIVAIF